MATKCKTATRKAKTRKGMGNPAMIATAVAPSAEKIVTRAMDDMRERRAYRREYERTHKVTVRKVLVWSVVVALATYVGVKTYKYVRANNLKKKIGDPTVQSCINIWNAIPNGAKQEMSFLDVLNPLDFWRKVGDEITQMWQETNNEAILAEAKRIYNNKLNTTKIARNFKMMYGIELTELLPKVMGRENYAVFHNCLNNGSETNKNLPKTNTATNTETGEKEQYYIVVTRNASYIRSEPKESVHNRGYFGSNVVDVAQVGDVVGLYVDNNVFTDGTIKFYKVDANVSGETKTCYINIANTEVMTPYQYKKMYNKNLVQTTYDEDYDGKWSLWGING